jgi:hypothetical protein
VNPDDLIRILDELGKRLGPTGEYVFGLAVRQVYIEAVVGIGLFAFALMVGAIVIPRVYRWQQADRSGYSERGMIATIGGLLAAMLLFGVTANAIFQLQNVLNPEYAALRAILGTVAPK